jgi:hypothetical protein
MKTVKAYKGDHLEGSLKDQEKRRQSLYLLCP